VVSDEWQVAEMNKQEAREKAKGKQLMANEQESNGRKTSEKSKGKRR
jgi:hypothetical protein